ncbi:5'-3' exoribonuclease pacman [Megachile rotundata]|uniref:5'-3' exoribonuclease pacman n=1 Tax=Megachile rotundata TaxID=143995 RepID=UPI003FCF31AF
MGIPKFYRYISERYPCLNETLKEHQMPEFDNLYLDVNGIIHGCSHPNDAEVSFRITEEDIFKNIFRYIELLFRMIQPQKLFFIAIDGVAPRAKINQQRGRRFRAAKDAEIQEAKARAEGIEIPKEKRFDSNAITPGTAFMYKVNEHLRYFVTYKISSDKLWQKCKVIFSGSEVPGEGEHKIMDYIRYMKAQPDYDIHTKHCLYGLDADLIMLGLCTHELHFTLLREEVTYDKKQTKILTPEKTKFCLFHISLLREYINHEFSQLREKLSFSYDLEKIIDDWILMGFLVGNDFIPHLPNLHIAHGALSILYEVYIDVLPTLEGYINEAGTLKLDRFEKFMERLSSFDILKFSEHYADLKYLEGKMGRPLTETEKVNHRKSESSEQNSSPKKAQDKRFNAFIKAVDEMSIGTEDELRDDESDSETYTMEFVQHKRDYYINKLKYEEIDEDFLRSQAEGYVTALQWNLHYYYNGCCSWTWYYPHHYAPYISDIKDFKNLKLEFELGEPFLPFEQLLAVLPPYSKELLPSAFQPLLTEEQSPIIDYYPMDFETDLNGKTLEWEAVILIPFIDATRLVDAMAPHYDKLTPEEKARNKHGPMYCYTHTEENLGVYKAVEYFPDIISHAKALAINREDLIVPEEKLVKGLCPGVQIELYYPGFPTLRYIEHTATLEKAKVKVFQRQSLRESMILHLTPPSELDLTTIASELLGKTVFVNWPHLTEAQVTGVSNCDTKLSLINPQMDYCNENINKEELKGSLVTQWNMIKKHITETYIGRLGIEIGKINVLVYVRPFIGSKYVFSNHTKLYLEKQWSEMQTVHAYQTIVKDISVHCPDVVLYKTVDDIFVPGSICFMLAHPYYGAMGKVRDPAIYKKSGRINVFVITMLEPSLDWVKQVQADIRTQYMQGSIAARRLGISSLLLSKITGTIYVKKSPDEFQTDDTKYNIGLNLKFTKKNEEIPGYTRKENGQWLYSSKVIDLIRDYMVKCPDLFERLSQNITNDFFMEENLFNKDTGEMSDIMAWLKEQLQGVENRACGVEALDPSVVKNIEEEVDAFLKTQNNTNRIVEMQVKPHLLFKPDLHLRNVPPDPKAQTRLLDRICCVKENFTVPLGYKGTVIGLQKMENFLDTMYDVVFDKTFVGGFSVGGCSEFRGYRLGPTDFINISYGQRIKHGKAGTPETTAESIDASKLASNQKAQSCANASAFASYRKKNNLPAEPSTSPKLRIIQKNTDDTSQNIQLSPATNLYKWKRYNSQDPQNVVNVRETYRTDRDVQQNTPSQNTQYKPSTMKPTSEFQALWNELHKIQKPSETVPQASMGSKVKPVTKNFPENSPQDPSAFLKAMLKISDGNTQQNAQAGISKTPFNFSVPQEENKTLDTPPLVQQLFDHARQTEKVKDEKTSIWYCSQLLNYYQLSGVGMPRYSYFTDGETNLIRAHILLPDKRVFVGDPCVNQQEAAGSAAKKVYRELKLANVLPNMKILLPPPQHWYSSRQNSSWLPNVRPASTVPYPHYPPKPQPPPHFPQWTPKTQHNQGYQQASGVINTPSNQYKSRSKLNHNETKTEIKNPTSFVPLQAQKKSRNITNKQTGNKDTNQCAKDNLQSVVQQKKKELPTKTIKETETGSTTSEKPKQAQSSSQQVQNTQNVIKPKKSRVAAKFCIPSQTEENHSKNTT